VIECVSGYICVLPDDSAGRFEPKSPEQAVIEATQRLSKISARPIDHFPKHLEEGFEVCYLLAWKDIGW
jgi:hypothetical protein